MSIFIGKDSRVIIQGITGRDGSFHSKRMHDYVTNVVGGVSPGKGGQAVSGLPVFDTVVESIKKTNADTSVIFVPGRCAASAIDEAIEAGIKNIIVITEGVPIHETVKLVEKSQMLGSRIIGPNTPGLISPGKVLAGIIPPQIVKPGRIGVVSRSGTLTYQVISELTAVGLGVSTAVGAGGDPIIGTSLIDVAHAFERDDETDAIVMVGEIGGNDEQHVANAYKKTICKPIISFIAGVFAPPQKRMGHAGAIISGNGMTAINKIDALEDAGIKVARLVWDIPELLKKEID